MDMESWLDGYDRRKHDLLGWLRDGGDTVSGAGDMVSELERVLGGIRSLVQARAAAEDLARLDDVLGGEVAMSDPLPVAAPEAPEAQPAGAEGILKSLSWMDAHTPESTPQPSTRSRTAARPAALDFLGAPSAPSAPTTEAPAENPLPPLPTPVETATAAPAAEEEEPFSPAPFEPVLLEPSPVVPTPLEPSPVEPARLEPAPVEPAPVVAAPASEELVAPAVDSCPHFEPARTTPLTAREALSSVLEEEAPSPISSAGLEDLLASVAQAPAPAQTEVATPAAEVAAPAAPPAAPPRRTQRPIVIDCPSGEERRAALEGVGTGPDTPYLLHAVVEVPRGGGTGYVYNDPKDVFVVVDHPGPDEEPSLGHVAYGFVPDTVSDDGAHLDTFVLSSGAAGPGEMLRVRPLGYLRRADGDHKLFCVPEKHRAQVMADIPDTVLKACETWRNPTGVSGGTWCDAGKARELVRRCAID